ncbi:bifunctional phosphoglucose/phosphomannose isomerase [Candidatus Parcubacteria bacterium]|nr:bifunctional phosphoglucose/phosphomannose isomerase [Candidatus Parcubacteria bacterium]
MEIDSSNMRKVIMDSPKQLAEGLALAEHIKPDANVSNVIICGIGGSALPAELIETLQVAMAVPMHIHKDYDLPKSKVLLTSLVICISYSGNTEETVSAMGMALEKKLQVVAIATGGKVAQLAKEHNIPLATIPSGIQPRCATGYIFSALIQILENAGLIDNVSNDIKATAIELPKITDELEQQGKELAETLKGALPVMYASQDFRALAMIWKIKFNENSKIPAFYNYFPELNHNEMVGYTGLKTLGIENLHAIILQDSGDHQRNKKRMELTAGVIEKAGGRVSVINIKEGSRMFKIFSSLLLGDFVSYYLALGYGTDPAPVAMVEEFKKNMSG